MGQPQLRKQRADDISVDVGEAELAGLVSVGEEGVVAAVAIGLGDVALHERGAAELGGSEDDGDIQQSGIPIRTYIGESDHWRGKTLFSAIVELARNDGVAGAAVTHGIEGFGANGIIHTKSTPRLSEDLPVTTEMTYTAERIERS